jgi:hypothetical protein
MLRCGAIGRSDKYLLAVAGENGKPATVWPIWLESLDE